MTKLTCLKGIGNDRYVYRPFELDGCDWDTMESCNGDESSKKKKDKTKMSDKDDDDDYFPMCVGDDKIGKRKRTCQRISKLRSMKKGKYLVGCGYCDDDDISL